MLIKDDLRRAQALAGLCFENPFRDGLEVLERQALGADYDQPGAPSHGPLLAGLAKGFADKLHGELRAGGERSAEVDRVYEGLIRCHLSYQLEDLLDSLTSACLAGGLSRRRLPSYKLFSDEALRLLDVPGAALALGSDLPHVFAFLFQRRRAYNVLTSRIIGTSQAVMSARAQLWESLFSADMARYAGGLFQHIDSVPTLIIGPAGVAKGRVAEALALARYVPFDVQNLRFTLELRVLVSRFQVGQDSAVTLVEALAGGGQVGEGWGNVRGEASELGVGSKSRCVVLSDVDKLSPSDQMQLSALLNADDGEGRGQFQGKLVSTAERELTVAASDGRFRRDLYHRLCADTVTMPGLATQLLQAPRDLYLFVHQILANWLGEEASGLGEAAQEVVGYVVDELTDHGWPGQLAELEQCVRSVLLRGSYQPALALSMDGNADGGGVLAGLGRRFVATDFDANGLLGAYCTLVYKKTGSYQEAARRLGLDRRTVKSHVDNVLLTELT